MCRAHCLSWKQDIYRILPSRAYKITLREEIYYGLYGKDDSVLYIADGTNSRGTLVLAGIRDGPLVETDHVAAFDAATGPHIHSSNGMSESRWMGPPIPPIGLLNVADPGAICHPSYTQACSLRRTFHHYKTSSLGCWS